MFNDDRKVLQKCKFNPNMVRDCAFFTSPKDTTTGFELPVDDLTSKHRKNRVGSVSSVTCGSKSRTKSFIGDLTTITVTGTRNRNRNDMLFLTNHIVSSDSIQPLDTTAMIQRKKNQSRSFKTISNLSVEMETNSHGLPAPAKQISSSRLHSDTLKLKKSSRAELKSDQQTEKIKIVPPKPNISVMMPKSLYCDLSIESVNQILAQSKPSSYKDSESSIGNTIEVIEPNGYDTLLQPTTEFSFSKTLCGDQLNQVRLIDEQISKLRLVASRYCHTARKLLQKRIGGIVPGALPATSDTISTSLGDIIGSDVFELRASIEQVLQSVHAVIRDLEEKKSRILTMQVPTANAEIDESDLLNWKQSNSTLSLNCKDISEENMHHIHHMLAEEDRICTLRRKVRSGLRNFAIRVRERSFPLVADTGYLDNYVDSYKDWDAQDKAENEPLIIF